MTSLEVLYVDLVSVDVQCVFTRLTIDCKLVGSVPHSDGVGQLPSEVLRLMTLDFSRRVSTQARSSDDEARLFNTVSPFTLPIAWLGSELASILGAKNKIVRRMDILTRLLTSRVTDIFRDGRLHLGILLGNFIVDAVVGEFHRIMIAFF